LSWAQKCQDSTQLAAHELKTFRLRGGLAHIFQPAELATELHVRASASLSLFVVVAVSVPVAADALQVGAPPGGAEEATGDSSRVDKILQHAAGFLHGDAHQPAACVVVLVGRDDAVGVGGLRDLTAGVVDEARDVAGNSLQPPRIVIGPWVRISVQ
jgi:hypothetical protein